MFSVLLESAYTNDIVTTIIITIIISQMKKSPCRLPLQSMAGSQAYLKLDRVSQCITIITYKELHITITTITHPEAHNHPLFLLQSRLSKSMRSNQSSKRQLNNPENTLGHICTRRLQNCLNQIHRLMTNSAMPPSRNGYHDSRGIPSIVPSLSGYPDFI